MKIFISWSGEMSKEIGETLRKWLPAALHIVKPYFTPDDLEKGTRWESEISRELETSDFGIICLTKDNLVRPWIMFETGALAKKFESARVCPILFGIEAVDIRGPLSQFTATKFNKKDIRKLFKTINSLSSEHRLEAEVLDDVFEMWWPRLEENINNILRNAQPDDEKEQPSESEMLQDISELIKMNINLTRSYVKSTVPKYFTRHFISISEDLKLLYNNCRIKGYDFAIPEIVTIARKFEKMVERTYPGAFPKTISRLQSIYINEEQESISEED